MPPNNNQPAPDQSQPNFIAPSPANNPPTDASPSAEPPATSSSSKPSRPLKKIVALSLIVAILIGAGGVGYTLYRKSADSKKFNEVAKKITAQETAGMDNYVKVAAVVNEFGQLLDVSTDQSASAGTDKLTAKVDKLKSYVDQSCKAKADDITAANFDSHTKNLKLNADQKKYLSDWKSAITSLEDSDYSNTGLCRDGQIMVIFASNLIKFIPGIATLTSVESNPSGLPTAAQIASLKAFTTLEITDQDKLEAALPHTTALLTGLKTLISDLYNEVTAVQRGDMATANKYEQAILALSSDFERDSKAFEDELTAFDKKINDAATSASQAEIAGIEYQKKHNSGNVNMQLDPALPAFRIVEASITGYGDKHGNSYPHATDIAGLADIDATVKELKTKGYLKDFNYASIGSDDNGFRLSAKLANGTVLSEKVEPAAQSI